MSKVLIWDLPTRLFHWSLTAGFLASFGIAMWAGERSRWFPVHMLLGLALAFVVLLRVVWGTIGSRYARFQSFVYRPSELAAYLKSTVTRHSLRYAGHNPGSALATFAILALIILVAGSGVLMSMGFEAAEEVHGFLAYALAAVVAVHILGVAWHSWRHRENLTATMITGRKEANPAEAIASSRPVVAVVFAVLMIVVIGSLFRNYDRGRAETRLPLTGIAVHLGEPEGH
jgi:cytochrome b